MPAATRPLSDKVSPLLESGITLTDGHHQISSNNNINQQQPCTTHLPSVLGLEHFSSFINTCSVDYCRSPDTVTTLLCCEGFSFGLNQTNNTIAGELQYCLSSDTDSLIFEPTSPLNSQGIYQNGQAMIAHCTNDVFQRLIPSDRAERSTTTKTASTHRPYAGHRSTPNHMPIVSGTLLALSIFFVLALLNGSASASKDFNFPDSNQGKSFLVVIII